MIPVADFRLAVMLRRLGLALVAAGAVWGAGAVSAQEVLGQAIARMSADNGTLAAFYKATGYRPIWVGSANRKRAAAYLEALYGAGAHGLPVASYRAGDLAAALRGGAEPQALARAEVAFSTSFAKYARDVQSGVLTPQRVDREIFRPAPRRDPVKTLSAFAQSSPAAFLRALPPQTREYQRLMAEKARLERELGAGGWGAQVPGAVFKPGQSGAAVTALSARLAAMGYLRGTRSDYGADVEQAVAAFQRDHGLSTDGIAGKVTLSEVNKDPEDRLKQVIAAMERERWLNLPLGKRHVEVNIPDFTARIIDNGRTVFATRAVVGANQSTHRTPEFSDVMEFMVINPTWNVPASITAREYLPMLKENPNAVPQLQLVDASGRTVSRGSVDFSAYDGGSFPYRLKEPPSEGNALGQVKFMFPNQHNIYLHDTPAKSLFSRESRAYSHGCIRLNDPQDFAYQLLGPQTANPQGFYQSQVATGRETVVELSQPLRVHLLYRTAFALDGDRVQYRRDVYGRDAKVFAALARAGVSLRAVDG